MNQQSLDRANAFLAAVATRIKVGEILKESPAEIGRAIGLDQPLAAARAVRALLARRRLEAAEGGYRLLEARPLEPGEREVVPRKPRARRARAAAAAAAPSGPVSHAELGREVVDRLIELGREVASLRASLRTAREEAKEAREARNDAERRARTLADRVRDLESRAEMAESNLRTVLAAAKGSGREVPVPASEMEAILGVLKDTNAGGTP